MALARFGGTAALMAASPGLPWKPLLLAAVAGVALGVWSLRQPVGKVAGAAAPEAVAKAPSSANGTGNTASAAASITPTTAPPAGTDVDAWLAAAEGDDAAALVEAGSSQRPCGVVSSLLTSNPCASSLRNSA